MKKYFTPPAVIVLIVILSALYFRPFRSVTPPASTPTPIPTVSIPSDWQAFKDENLKFSVNFPPDLETSSNGDNSILITPKFKTPGPGPINFIYISVVTPDKINEQGTVYNYNPNDFQKLISLGIGESVSFSDDVPELTEWFTYTRVDDTQIDGNSVKRFENTKPWEFPPGTTETRYIFEKNENIYILGSYTGGENTDGSTIDPRIAHQIILSFNPDSS